jgi:hypothetical protein
VDEHSAKEAAAKSIEQKLIRKINKHLLIKRQDTQAIEFNSHFNDT